MEKKVFIRIKAMAVIISLLVSTLFCGCGKDKEKDDPNLGLYTNGIVNAERNKYKDMKKR